jgi:drug/metabolite transporter (DMT)-like permease
MSHTARRNQRVGVAQMIGSAAFWAAGTVLSKAVLNDSQTAPLPLLSVQLSTSVAVLAVVLVAARRSPRGAWRHGWTGLLEPGAAYSLSIVGLAMTSATNATVLGSLEPMIVPLLAWIVLRQPQRITQLALVAVATIGATVVAATGTNSGSDLGGDVLVVAGVVAAALYVVLSSRHISDHHPVVLAVVQQTWALTLTIAAALIAALVSNSRWPASAAEYAAAGASGVCLYAIPFSLYLHALRHLDVTVAASYLCLIPVLGVAGSHFVLGEPIAGRQLLGSLVVVAALYTNALAGR